MLPDIMMPEENLHVSVKEQGSLNLVRSGLAKNTSWQGILESPSPFPKFEVENDLIFRLNNVSEQRLIPLDIIHKGERKTRIAIQHAHEILGNLGFDKTLAYIC